MRKCIYVLYMVYFALTRQDEIIDPGTILRILQFQRIDPVGHALKYHKGVLIMAYDHNK